MIQFNLLPDVKLEYIKARRSKRLVMLISALVTGVTVTILVLLFLVVNVAQKTHLKNLTDDIKRDGDTIKQTPDVEKMLTIQSQLQSLTVLHDQKPVASRLFTFIQQMTPTDVSISKIEVDFVATTIRITGTSKRSVDPRKPLPESNVNRFVDTLKFAEFTRGDPKKFDARDFKLGEQERAFSEVVLSTLDLDEDGANYTIAFKFNPAIFVPIKDDANTTDVDESTHTVNLIITNTVTTRSRNQKPGQRSNDEAPLFDEPEEPEEETGQ